MLQLLSSASMTLDACRNAAAASGVSNFGLYNGQYCVYMTAASSLTAASATACSTACPGSTTFMCGGTSAVSAFVLTAEAACSSCQSYLLANVSSTGTYTAAAVTTIYTTAGATCAEACGEFTIAMHSCCVAKLQQTARHCGTTLVHSWCIIAACNIDGTQGIGRLCRTLAANRHPASPCPRRRLLAR